MIRLVVLRANNSNLFRLRLGRLLRGKKRWRSSYAGSVESITLESSDFSCCLSFRSEFRFINTWRCVWPVFYQAEHRPFDIGSVPGFPYDATRHTAWSERPSVILRGSSRTASRFVIQVE